MKKSDFFLNSAKQNIKKNLVSREKIFKCFFLDNPIMTNTFFKIVIINNFLLPEFFFS